MAEVTQEQIQEAIAGYTEPHMNKDLVSAKAVKGIDVSAGEVEVKVELGFPAKGFKDELASALRERIESVAGVTTARVDVDWKIVAR